MSEMKRWPRLSVIAGLVGMVIGAIDPLEGSVVVLAGIALVAVGVLRSDGKYSALVIWALTLVMVGVGAMFGLSALGGFGGSTGRSSWWALAILPYPVGWIMGLVGGVGSLRRTSGPSMLSGAH